MDAGPAYDQQQRICGIIMPISHVDDDHTAEHWTQVRRVIEVAIEGAHLIPQPVWQNDDFDVIQARILQNLFENEIVVCDISTRNPNVMLEFGMRLTTKRPTIVVAEEGTPLPFDTAIIKTEFYDQGLSFVKATDFINRLTKAVASTLAAVVAGTYHAYLEHFRFETVEPSTVPITVEKLLQARTDEIISRVSRMEAMLEDMFNRTHGSLALPHPANTSTTNSETTRKSGFPVKSNDSMVVGVRVFHTKFGNGTIAEKIENKLEIDFDDAGRKRVLDTFVKLI